MDLLLLGFQSRKKHLRVRKDIRRDQYGMEDVDEFFEIDSEDEKALALDAPVRTQLQYREQIVEPFSEYNSEYNPGQPQEYGVEALDFAELTQLGDFEYPDFNEEPNDDALPPQLQSQLTQSPIGHGRLRRRANPLLYPEKKKKKKEEEEREDEEGGGGGGGEEREIGEQRRENQIRPRPPISPILNNSENDNDNGNNNGNNNSSSTRARRSSFNYVARKINFDNDETEGAGETASSLSRRSPITLAGNKQSPLRSPLQEQQHRASVAQSPARATTTAANAANYDYDYGNENYPDYPDYGGYEENEQDQFDDRSHARGEGVSSEEPESTLDQNDRNELDSSQKLSSVPLQSQDMELEQRISKRRRSTNDDPETSVSLFMDTEAGDEGEVEEEEE